VGRLLIWACKNGSHQKLGRVGYLIVDLM